VFAVANKLKGVPDRVLLLDVGRLPAVLEIIAAALAHVGIPDAAEIDPQVRELVGEQRPGVEQLAAVDLLALPLAASWSPTASQET